MIRQRTYQSPSKEINAMTAHQGIGPAGSRPSTSSPTPANRAALTTVVATCYLLGVSTPRMEELTEALEIIRLSGPRCR